MPPPSLRPGRGGAVPLAASRAGSSCPRRCAPSRSTCGSPLRTRARRPSRSGAPKSPKKAASSGACLRCARVQTHNRQVRAEAGAGGKSGDEGRAIGSVASNERTWDEVASA
eukprot:4780931-Pleurochrysis_carterae.AAC.1